MEPIIEPIPVQLIEQELTADRLLRHTNKADNDIYVINAHNAPNTMREIGRLREISFRSAGGGTGKACDIDEFDTMPVPCQQLLVWNPDKREIIGAYRFIGGWDVDVIDGVPHIAMGHMFNFSDRFLNEILPVTIELGRSFVRPEYQSTRPRQPVGRLGRLNGHLSQSAIHVWQDDDVSVLQPRVPRHAAVLP